MTQSITSAAPRPPSARSRAIIASHKLNPEEIASDSSSVAMEPSSRTVLCNGLLRTPSTKAFAVMSGSLPAHNFAQAAEAASEPPSLSARTRDSATANWL
eukprot:CAMPEP_0206522286 /NCGR_PEP_ID=MMETSP0324_2-20121206/66908_1 /ASSEMBLY_ACC=CAM_ASM_000836 /TAXON_ID=2866 /ORGANISM="Crypthecodinium cohnii, Strain Seligo" /LENGTH=99 /DNA_ID=CAMNT_0054016453 /DNA_START=428 /DNA_END=727 /DNA_ORIENTATION=+